MEKTNLQLVECPRDAMQGWPKIIPTAEKITYLQSLLSVGFHTIDCGSFVSPRAIPQMADTLQVLNSIENNTDTKLLVIVANKRGAEQAVQQQKVHYLGFPFSISETFQQLNTNSSIAQSLGRVADIQQLCLLHQKQLVIYLSMGFGNPYGDAYDQQILLRWAGEIAAMGVTTVSLADTVGVATPAQVSTAVATLALQYPQVQIGIHLHSSPQNWQQKIEAAVVAGCTRFDGALLGIGGCPMAKNELVGNMNMEWMVVFLQQQGLLTGIDNKALQRARQLATTIFI